MESIWQHYFLSYVLIFMTRLRNVQDSQIPPLVHTHILFQKKSNVFAHAVLQKTQKGKHYAKCFTIPLSLGEEV